VRVDLTDVSVEFGARPVLSDVTLRFEEGDQVAVLGPSGAGKTTLLRLIVGAVAPAAGDIRVDGSQPLESRSGLMKLRRSIGCVRQRDDLVLGLTARTNILSSVAHQWRLRDWSAVLLGRVPPRFDGRLSELASRHEIEDVLSVPVERLSGGQRQRVALARALFGRPRLLLADEWTTGLDPVRARRAIDDLRGAGATLIATTHDLAIAKEFPRIVALRDGEVVLDDSTGRHLDIEHIYGAQRIAEVIE
jgi:ABC-type phosphate/phosphonate transport system ATPase subunit